MKIDSKRLRNFIKCATINENANSCILHFNPEGLKIAVRSTDSISAGEGTMKKNCFLEYTEGVYPIKDVSKFNKLLELFPGLVELNKEANLLVLSGNIDDKHSKKVSYVLAGEEFIDNELKQTIPGTFDNGFSISKNLLADAVKSMRILKSSKVIFEVKDNIFSLKVGEDNFDSITERISVTYPDGATTIGSTFEKIVDVLPDTANIAFKTNYLVLFNIRTEDFDVRVVIAPLIDEDKKGGGTKK